MVFQYFLLRSKQYFDCLFGKLETTGLYELIINNVTIYDFSYFSIFNFKSGCFLIIDKEYAYHSYLSLAISLITQTS